jgi:hypothetical protein
VAKKSATSSVTSDVAASETSASDGLTKADVMRDALKAGITKPTEAVEYIKDKFGVVLTLKQFSNFKSAEKANAGKRKSGRRAGRPAASESAIIAVVAPAAPAAKNGKAGNALELARQIKDLVQTYGAGTVKGMVDVFEK